MSKLIRRLRSDKGQAMVEYSIILALISIAAIGIITQLGEPISNAFQSVLDALG